MPDNQNTMSGSQKTIQFVKIDNTHVKCVVCEKQLLKRGSSRHSCRGAPRNVCVFCRKHFTKSSNLATHKKRCKHNPANMVPVQEQQQQQTVVQNITNNNITNTIINNTIINIQFGKETISELVDMISEGDERMKAIANKLNERLNIQTEIEKLLADKENYSVKKHQDLVFQEKNADDLLHVLLDLVYFNTDIPQNHTIRKINKKSEMIEIRDNDLWSPIPTNTAVHTILTPICELAQGITDDAKITYPTRQYTKQEFNEILYSKTHRGYLNMERILQPYEKPQLTSEWQAFRDEVASTYIPCCGYRRSDLNKADTLQTLKEIAFRLGVLDYCPYKDGELMFEEILQRFPE